MDKALIFNRVRLACKLKNDAELSKFLGIQPNTLSGWYKRGSVDFDLLFEKCEHLNYDNRCINKIFVIYFFIIISTKGFESFENWR